jgi:hypothetical protein
MKLRKEDFEVIKAAKKGTAVSKLAAVFDGENVNPNTTTMSYSKTTNAGFKKSHRPATPGDSDYFTDDYWGVPKNATPGAAAVSPEKVVVRAPRSPKSPKSPGGRKLNMKKTKSARKAMLKKAMLELEGSRKAPLASKLAAAAPQPTLREMAADKLIDFAATAHPHAIHLRAWATRILADYLVSWNALFVQLKSGIGELQGHFNASYATRPAHTAAMSASLIFLVLFVLTAPFNATSTPTTAAMSAIPTIPSPEFVISEAVISEAVISEAVISEAVISSPAAEISDITPPMAAPVAAISNATTSEPIFIPPYDITSVSIEGRSMLQWRVEGPAVVAGSATVDIVVLIDDKIHFKTDNSVTLTPDISGAAYLDMTIDMMPLTEGLHSFLIIVASTASNFYRESGAKFLYEIPVKPWVAIEYPSHGEVVDSRDFSGLKFNTGDIPEATEGWYVSLQIDGETFNIPFFEGEINLEGLVKGTHNVEMKVFDREGVVVSDGSAYVWFEVV